MSESEGEMPLMESVVNSEIPDIPIVLREEVIRLSSLAAWDTLSNGISWENISTDEQKAIDTETKAAIMKFIELEDIKQEFKGDKYRLIGQWKKP